MRIATWPLSWASSASVVNAFLHAPRGVHRVVGRWERRHDLVTHGLDDGALVGFGGLAHDVEATAHHLTSFYVAELFVKLRAAHHVGEQDRNLHILTHGFLLECARGEPGRL
jgi:hypothetical protein